MHTGILFGLLSAVLFGASVPLAKALVGATPPIWLAALLYLGAGGGLLVVLAVRRRGRDRRSIAWPNRADWRWVAAAIAAGGVAGPVALMYGLALTSGAAASLLLNLEAVVTALAAWFLFGENFDRRVALGMLAIVAGAAVLAASPGAVPAGIAGPALIALACLCWALDNNLTRKASASDAVLLAALKGLVAGCANTVIALALGFAAPPWEVVAGAAAVGFLGYGVSLVLFIVALRELGTARAGAYFAVAPFFGAALAVAMGQDSVTLALGIAAVLMGAGVWLHVAERHDHEHQHAPLEHTHAHRHDEHHRHAHAVAWDGREPHVHSHVHASLRHTHPHYPDVHHRHGH
ncbi:MAG: EamA family transporter [Burkholderiales bacterium]